MVDEFDINIIDSEKEIKTIAKGAGIIFASTIISVVLKYAFELYLARSLGPDLFGIFFLGFTIFKVLERISIFGIQNGAIRYVSIYNGVGDKKRLKGTILASLAVVAVTSSITIVITVPFAGIISSRIFNDIRLTPVLIIFSFILIFNAATEIMVDSTQGLQIMRYKAITRMLFEPGLRILLAVTFVIAGWSLLGAAFAFALSIIAGTVLSFYFLKKIFPDFADRTKTSRIEVRELINFSWPLAFVGFFNIIIFQVNTLMLGYFWSSNEVGIFGATQRTAMVIQVILTSFNTIFSPLIADLYNRRQLKKLESLYKVVTNWIIIVSLPIFILIMFFPKEILGIWGPEYKTGWIGLILIGAAMIINCSVGSVKNIIMMTGRTRVNLINDGTTFTLAIILNILLIPKYGVIGASISFAASVIFINIVGLIEVYIFLKIHPYKKSIIKPLAAGAIISIIIFLAKKYIITGDIKAIFLVLIVIILMVVYAGLIYLFKLNSEDKMVLELVVSKLRGKKIKNNRDRKL